MISERTIELANREIDGRNSPEESRELRRSIASSAEAATYFDELREMARIFTASPTPDPPPELKQRILHALHARIPGPAAQETPLRRPARSPWPFRRERALTFLAGAAAAVCFFAVLTMIERGGSPVDERLLYGSLLRGEDIAGRPIVHFAEEGVSGELRAAVSGETVVLELVLESKVRLDVCFTGGEGFSFRGFLAPEGMWTAPAMNAGRLEVAVVEGVARLVVVGQRDLGIKGSPIALRITADSRTIFDERIDLR